MDPTTTNVVPTPEQIAATAPDEADGAPIFDAATEAFLADPAGGGEVIDVAVQPVVTPAQAAILALHAIEVQGGSATPEREAERLLADVAGAPDAQERIDACVRRMSAELAALNESRDIDAGYGPTPAPTERVLVDGEPQLPIAKIRRYKELKELADASEAEFKAFKEEAAKLEAELVEAFADAGVNNIRLDGKTIYLHRSVYARRCEGVTAEDVKAALIAAGESDLVTTTVNANTLSAWVRELTEDDDAPGLPAPVVGILEPGERFSVRINAAGSRPKNKTHSK